jgi:trimeric autotransporter adhesin
MTLSCFAVPANYSYGNESRTLPNIRGPGIAQGNLMLSKNWYYKERYRLQLRAEAIDTFNTPQFGNPSTGFAVNSTTFGTIGGSDGYTRRVMEFALKLYF